MTRPQLSAEFARELGSTALPAGFGAIDNAVAQSDPHRGALYGDANAASSQLMPERPRTENRRRKGAAPIMFIAGGAAAILAVVVAVFAMRGGSSDDETPAREAATKPATTTVAKSTTPTATPDERPDKTPGKMPDVTRREPEPERVATSDEHADEPATKSNPRAPAPSLAAGDGADAVSPSTTDPDAPPAPPPTATSTVAPTQPPAPVKRPAPARRLGGKKVVLEYDTTAPKKAPPAVVKEDSAAVGKARASYFSGNRRLYAGDANGAITLYQQALAVYPGYVAGYRGLGLAYAQKGDKANALKSFRTYIGAVPGAKDVALIRQRIAALSKKK